MTSRKTCAGCGASITRGVDVELAPEVSVVVCPGRGGGYHYAPPSLVCARKARDKAKLCPGCGATGTGWGICTACRAAVVRGGTGVDAPKVFGLDVSLVTSRYVGGDVGQDLVKIIADIAAARGPRARQPDGWGTLLAAPDAMMVSQHTGQPRVELDVGQRKAIEKLGALIRELAEAMYAEGRREGRDLLGSLAKGETTIREWDDRHVEWAAEEREERSARKRRR